MFSFKKYIKKIYRILHVDIIVTILCKRAWKQINARKVVFANWIGGGCRCNLKYLAHGIRQRIPDADIVWLVDSHIANKDEFPSGTRLVQYSSLRALKELATCKILVNNAVNGYYINAGFRKKPGQYYFQTWHGSLGIKRIGFDYREGQAINEYRRNIRHKDAEMLDFLITNSEFEADIFRRQWYGRGIIKYFGHPRNDILFKGNRRKCTEKIQKRYALPKDCRIVLFAPTFRERKEVFDYSLDHQVLCKALRVRFGGDWRFAVRYHPNDAKLREHISPAAGVVDVTDYIDMQELMVASDVVVTDYSSCIYDFMLTGRVGFIYAKDLEEYNNVRGFYYPIEETPFPVAKTEAELVGNILSFDEGKYRADVEAFLKEKGCVEDGHATERTVDLIERLMRG